MDRFLKFVDSRPGVAIFTALCVLIATYARDFVDSRVSTRMDPVVKQLTAIHSELVQIRESQKTLEKLLEHQERRIERLEELRVPVRREEAK